MQVAAAICGLWAVVARDLGTVLLPVTLEVVNNVVSMYRTHLEPASLDCLAEVSQPRHFQLLPLVAPSEHGIASTTQRQNFRANTIRIIFFDCRFSRVSHAIMGCSCAAHLNPIGKPRRPNLEEETKSCSLDSFPLRSQVM